MKIEIHLVIDTQEADLDVYVADDYVKELVEGDGEVKVTEISAQQIED